MTPKSDMIKPSIHISITGIELNTSPISLMHNINVQIDITQNTEQVNFKAKLLAFFIINDFRLISK
jgi:hypothetical protein